MRPFARLLAACFASVLVVGSAAAEDAPTEDVPPADAPADAPSEPAAPPEAPAQPEAPAPPEAAPKREKLRWLVIPNVSYDSDDGFGLGARAEIVQPEEGLDPYRSGWVIHGFATTNGFHHHRFRFDLVGLGKKQKARVTGHFAYRAWLNDGYWGIGRDTEREVAYETDDPDDPARRRYRYTLIQPFGQVALRHAIDDRVSAFGSVNVRYTVVEADPGSLLAEERPLGMDGGLGVQLIVGGLWDSREPEVTPERGALVEVSGRVVTGAYTFGGPLGSVRFWVKLAEGVVLGQRILGESLVGDIPFYEMVHWGGVVPLAGFGGADTLRGVAFGRWRAPGKAIANTELRLDVVRHPFLKQEVRWQLVPFVDVGTVWGEVYDGPVPGPAPFQPHPAAGAGVRVIWAETMVGRIDGGVSRDLTDEGPVADWGFYLAFDHMF